MTDLTEVRNFNGFPQTAFKSELKQFYGIIFAVLSSFFYRFVKSDSFELTFVNGFVAVYVQS